MRALGSILLWTAISALGAGAFGVLALHRGETISAAWLLTAALCTYAVGYRFYARAIARRVFALHSARPTPAVRLDDGRDYVPTNPWVVFGHHFAAIAGAGPLVGPILAAQFGYLPGAIWIIVGVVLAGAVQDLVVLCASVRRDGKSLAQMAREEAGSPAGTIALVAILGIILILIAFLALVVVQVLAKSPWGVVTIGLTIPIALLMGVWMRWLRPGRVLEASAIGLVLLVIALLAGKWVAADPGWAKTFTFTELQVAAGLIVYGFLASVLPIWLLLAPRDYLSAFVKVGTVALLAIGVALVMPPLLMPAINPLCVGDGAWARGTGPVSSGTIFPFCFITIACGAISGFHALVSSGTTPKLITDETHAPPIGYGAMLMESFVAVLALIAACSLEPGIYYAMNAAQLKTVGDLGTVASTVNGWTAAWSTSISADDLRRAADQVGEPTLVGRTGGAATLAVGMTRIFSGLFGGHGADLWYHFAIMFEALFILTTIDAGTRVGRFLFQEAAGHVWKPLGRLGSLPSALLCSALIVAGWGYFLIAAVADPKGGGVRALLPLFGIANQLLAAVALCVCTVIIVRMGKAAWAWVTAMPLAWLVVVTEWAGAEKLFSQVAGVGLLTGQPGFNQYLNAALIAAFMAVIAAMVAICAWECGMLLTGRKPLHTMAPPEPQPSEAELREA